MVCLLGDRQCIRRWACSGAWLCVELRDCSAPADVIDHSSGNCCPAEASEVADSPDVVRSVANLGLVVVGSSWMPLTLKRTRVVSGRRHIAPAQMLLFLSSAPRHSHEESEGLCLPCHIPGKVDMDWSALPTYLPRLLRAWLSCLCVWVPQGQHSWQFDRKAAPGRQQIRRVVRLSLVRNASCRLSQRVEPRMCAQGN